jgi:Tol biopolymer transport system component
MQHAPVLSLRVRSAFAVLAIALPFLLGAPAFGQKIAFVRSDDIWVMDPSGANQQRLTTNRSANLPTWSPSRNAIAYMRTGPRQTDLWLLQFNNPGVGGLITGVTETQLTNDAQGENGPEWSPDGSRIVFQSGPPAQLWTLNVATRTKTQLTFGSSGYWWPSWSPDGQQLAYASGSGGIYVMAAQPGATPTLLSPVGLGIDLEWSIRISNQSHIAMFYQNQVWVLDVNHDPFTGALSAGAPRQVTAFSASFPTWSPDASRLAFHGFTSQGGIYTADQYGGSLIQLTNSNKDSRAAWNR